MREEIDIEILTVVDGLCCGIAAASSVKCFYYL
jgi:hypothetical protein